MVEQTPLHIAFFLDDFYPASGGIGRSMQTQISELVRLGHKVTLFAPEHQLQIPDNCEMYATPSFYLSGAPSHTCSLKFSKKLAKQISASHTFDAVHSQSERGALVLAARVAKLQQIPHIHTFHANIAGTHAELPFLSLFSSLAYAGIIAPILARVTPARGSKNIHLPPDKTMNRVSKMDWRSLARIAAHVDHFVTPSHFMMETITSCLPDEYKERGYIIPTGVNPAFTTALQAVEKEPRNNQTVRFLSIGRLAKEKRVEAIASAFMQANLPNAELHFVGSGDQEAALKNFTSKNKAIFFHSHAKNIDEVAAYYVNSDAFVLASYGFDNQPITLIEAAAAGLPILYCDPRLTVGVSEENSILSNSPSVEDIAHSFTQLSDPGTRAHLAAGSLRLAPSLSPEAMAKRYVELYRRK